MPGIPPFTVTVIGGPTAVFEYAGLRWITDPTFDAPGEYASPAGTLVKLDGPAVDVSSVEPIDVVLLSHDQHADNLDHVGRALVARVDTVVSTLAAAAQIDDVTGLGPWQSTTIGEATVTAVPARHGPEGCEPITGDVTGFVLEAPGEATVYVSGDNAAVELVRTIAERFPDIRVALLFTGAARVGAFDNAALTLTAADAVAASDALGDARIVPVHANGWAHFSEGRDELAAAFTAAGHVTRLVMPAFGETVRLEL